MPRGPSRPHPSMTVLTAAKLAAAIRENNAGRPMNRILLAEAMRRSPSSSEFRELITASGKYGFTKGSYASETIELTNRGEQLTKPRSEDERLSALREGMNSIPLFGQLLTHFANNKLPASEFLKNTLERPPFSVPAEWAAEVAEIFTASGQEVGFVRNVNGSPYVILEAGPPTGEGLEPAGDESSLDGQRVDSVVEATDLGERAVVVPNAPSAPGAPASATGSTPPTRTQFFIAHGRNKTPLSQLQKILKEFDIPYVVAEEEANAGRPISEKVRDLMKSCSAGIFIFSADEEFQDASGQIVRRPRENVVYELGAASLEYGRRIVIFKEDGVTFPSDFRDLGYIEFEKDRLDAKAMDLLKELIALKAVRIAAGV